MYATDYHMGGPTVTEQFSVDGQTAVVTGGTKGIGRAIAERFVAEGADVAICARTAEEVDDAARALDDGPGGRAIGRTCDVRDREEVEALVDAAAEAFGSVDCLVNNAGASFMAGF